MLRKKPWSGRNIKSLLSIKDLSEGLVGTIIKEAEKLLNSPNTIQRMPLMSSKHLPVKYLVAAKNSKRGMHECTVHCNHVNCTCPYYKYNTICKHIRLCVAESVGILKEHIDYSKKSLRWAKPSLSDLVGPEKNAVGKKGGRHKNRWRPSRYQSSDTCSQAGHSHPYSDIHHNNNPLIVCFLCKVSE